MYERVENIRWLFYCNRCRIAKIIDEPNLENAYLSFLDLYDENKLTSKSLEDLLRDEGLIRSKEEIDALDINDKLVYDIANSKKDYFVYYQLLKGSSPEFGSNIYALDIDESLKEVLKSNDINRLYKFQEDTIYEILDGKDTVIVAPTAAGKTEAFTIPILENIEQGSLQALFVYPTKALARDQLVKIRRYASALELNTAVLDGDTPTEERRAIIRKRPEIILTNFDTIHYHLIHRTPFTTLLNGIKYLVIDEVHTYTGIFGSHIHYILKRLGRFSKFQIIGASATLPNAAEFCQRLFDRKVSVIEGKGKRGEIHFAMIYPTLRSQRALTLDLLKKLTTNHKTLIFSDSHLSAELLTYYGSRQGIKIKVHRAGLSQAYRGNVEEQFKRGELMAISATPTLELGIDIGDLDVVISSKIPINRLEQRLGRAARKQQTGYAFLAFGNDPISQYYKNHPEDYLNDREYAYIDPYNPTVQKYQVLAMICDKPLSTSSYDEYNKVIDELLDEQLIKETHNRFIATRDAIKKLHEINIRGSGKEIDIYIKNKRVGERTLPIALEELHDDAVYFLAGRRYRVEQLVLDKYKAHLSLLPNNYPYYTRALSEEWPTIEEVYEKRYVFNIEVLYCLLSITKRIIGYVNIEVGSEVAKGEKVMLDDIVEYDYITKGLVFRAPEPIKHINNSDDPIKVKVSAYHATEHVIIEGSKTITGGASQDLGGISLGSSGLIFVYDGTIGGNGASRALYDRLGEAFTRGKSILAECRCKSEDGCPRCTYSYRCGNNNEFLHKYASLEVFTSILNGVKTSVEEIEGDLSLV